MLDILATIIALAAVAACSGGDDNKSTATGAPTARVSQTDAASAAATTSAHPSATASGASTATAATGSGTSGGNGNAPVEACDLMTKEDVASVLHESASDFENDSLGKQIPPAPFTSGVQCQYNNLSNLTDMAWLNASFAPSSAADQVKQALITECGGQGIVSGLGDFACFPLYVGQLKVVKGSTYLDFFLYADGVAFEDEQAGMKALAQKAIEALP